MIGVILNLNMKLKKLAFYIILIGFSFTFIYPFLWMASMSLKPQSDLNNIFIFTTHLTFDNYKLVFQKIPIGRALINSTIVATFVTFSVLLFSSLIGYALSRLKFFGRNFIFNLILFTMIIPGQLILIPLYTLMVTFNWVDSYLALILPFMINAMGIMIFRQTFLSIPFELAEASRMEGAGEFTILRKVFIPLAKPAAVTVGIITFMNTWNEVLWPMIVIRDKEMMTMPQMIALFSKGGQAGGQLGVELAASMLLVIPILVTYLFFQKYFIESIASSGIKG